jgi:hypothetical protein
MLSTEMEDSLNSAVVFNDKEIMILLNAGYCKAVDVVLDAVSHELAHAMCGHENENAQWREQYMELLVFFIDNY